MTAKRSIPLLHRPIRLEAVDWAAIDAARGSMPRQQWMAKTLLDAAKKQNRKPKDPTNAL